MHGAQITCDCDALCLVSLEGIGNTEEAPSERFHLARILVVDDDAPLLRLCRFLLTHAGHEVLVALDGVMALQLLQPGPVDLIILDLDMPVMNGRDFLRELELQLSRPPVLILTASDSRAAQRELGAEGAMGKPFDPNALLAEVNYLLG